MNRIKYIISVLTVFALFSCKKEDDNLLFKESPAERLQNRIDENRNILVGAKNGWITSYNPSDRYGYFNLWFKFNKDGTVRTLSDIPLVNNNVGSGGKFTPKNGYYKDTTTKYRVSYENSVDLVFEEPMALAYLYSLSLSTSGIDGEFEFYIAEATPDQVVLKSKKRLGTKGQIILKRATAEDKDKIVNRYEHFYNIVFNEFRGFLSNQITYYNADNSSTIYSINLEKRLAYSLDDKIIPIKSVSLNKLILANDSGKDVVYNDKPICSNDLSGTWDVISQGNSTYDKAANNPLKDYKHVVTINYIAKRRNYLISDPAAGAYIAWYKSELSFVREVPGFFTESCGILRGFNSTIFSRDYIDWKGKLNEDGTLNVSWRNRYGDTATAVYTKRP